MSAFATITGAAMLFCGVLMAIFDRFERAGFAMLLAVVGFGLVVIASGS